MLAGEALFAADRTDTRGRDTRTMSGHNETAVLSAVSLFAVRAPARARSCPFFSLTLLLLGDVLEVCGDLLDLDVLGIEVELLLLTRTQLAHEREHVLLAELSEA